MGAHGTHRPCLLPSTGVWCQCWRQCTVLELGARCMAHSAGAGASGWYWCLYWYQCPVLAVVTVHGTTACCVVLVPVHDASAHAGAGIHCLVPEPVPSGWYQWLALVPGA